jgi:DNA-binding IclR family transcriptional regulator
MHGLQMTSVIGGRNPAHCTALGKCLLAFALGSEKAVAAYVEQHGPLQRRTPRTLTTAARLHREFMAIRRDGHAVDREESEAGVNCIAFPVFLGSPARPTGAVSISALAHRTPLSRLMAAAPEIRACIEQRLVTRPLLTG